MGLERYPEELTIHELAEVWRTTPGTVRRICHLGAIPGAYKVGGQWRIPREAIERYRERSQADVSGELLAPQGRPA